MNDPSTSSSDEPAASVSAAYHRHSESSGHHASPLTFPGAGTLHHAASDPMLRPGGIGTTLARIQQFTQALKNREINFYSYYANVMAEFASLDGASKVFNMNSIGHFVFLLSTERYMIEEFGQGWSYLFQIFDKIEAAEIGFLLHAKKHFMAQPAPIKDFIIDNILRRKPRLCRPIPPESPSTNFDLVSELPPELQIKIFDNLDGWSVIRAAGVSRSWRAMALDLSSWTQRCRREKVVVLPEPRYKPRPSAHHKGRWMIPSLAQEPAGDGLLPVMEPPFFYSRSTIMYTPPNDFFGIRWHGESYGTPEMRPLAEWVRFNAIKSNWATGVATNVVDKDLEVESGTVTGFQCHAKVIVLAVAPATLMAFAGDSMKTRFIHNFTHDNPLTAIAISPDGGTIFSADTGIKVWDAVTGEILAGFTGHTRLITCMTFTCDNLLVTGSLDGTVRIWESYRSGRSIEIPVGSPVETLVASDESLFIGTSTGSIHVWDIATKSTKGVCGGIGSMKNVSFLEHLPQKNILITASNDLSIRLWNSNTGEHLGILHSANHAIAKLTVEGDFVYTQTVCGEFAVHNWRLQRLVHCGVGVFNFFKVPNYDFVVATTITGGMSVVNIVTGNHVVCLKRNGADIGALALPNKIVPFMAGNSTQVFAVFNTDGNARLLGLDFDWPYP